MDKKEYINRIKELQDNSGCWNVDWDNRYGPELTHYVPNYKSTLWTLILLADIEVDRDDPSLKLPLKTIVEHFWDDNNGIFTIGKSHFPIPCLNGNMLYLINYFKLDEKEKTKRVIRFFHSYQRFDDGDYKTPRDFPYFGNKSCYGDHSCYWGVVKLLKGLSFVENEDRDKLVNDLMEKLINFILLHRVCFSSHRPEELIHKMIGRLSIPNMYKSDFLEVLWLLFREGIKDDAITGAIELLQSKKLDSGKWKIDKKVKDLVLPLNNKIANEVLNKRINSILNFYT